MLYKLKVTQLELDNGNISCRLMNIYIINLHVFLLLCMI